MEQEYGRDFTAYARREWERVSLQGVQHLNMSAWRQFTADFEFKLGQVEDVGEWEVKEKLMRELPAELRKGLKD